jgi:ribose/xylose/arabinose/galactoside ABC-type transport system permease subunit
MRCGDQHVLKLEPKAFPLFPRSVFVGGTPPWGGIGTVLGGAIGALTVSFIQTGVLGVGLSGFYVQIFYGLIIILSLLGHRWNQARYR